jgi:putative ABC transport system substrate-binding protein
MKARLRLGLPFALPLGALAQPSASVNASGRPLRILQVTYRGLTDVERGFADHFRQRGLRVEFSHVDIALDTSRLPAVVQGIRSNPPDLISSWGSGVTLGLAGPWAAPDPARFITDIPIVFSLVAEPVGAGIVPALASSGRQLTGVSHMASVAAQYQVMAAYRPFRRVGLVYSANEPNSLAVLAQWRSLGRERGFEVLAQPFARDASGKPVLEGALDRLRALREQGAEWLYLPPDSFLSTQLKTVLPAALALGLPSFASTEPQMRAGALLGLVSRYFSVGQFAGYKAEQILVQGVPPSKIPIETLSRMALQVNLPVARQLRLLPPLGFFNQAELIDP